MGRLSNLQERPSGQIDSDPDFNHIAVFRTPLCFPTLNWGSAKWQLIAEHKNKKTDQTSKPMWIYFSRANYVPDVTRAFYSHPPPAPRSCCVCVCVWGVWGGWGGGGGGGVIGFTPSLRPPVCPSVHLCPLCKSYKSPRILSILGRDGDGGGGGGGGVYWFHSVRPSVRPSIFVHSVTPTNLHVFVPY